MRFLTAAQRDLVLDQTELQYADGHHGAFSLNALKQSTGLELARLVAEFGSRQTLVDAVLLRVLAPLGDQRVAALGKAKAAFQSDLQPAHVIGCLVLPILNQSAQYHSARRIAFLERASGDTDVAVRNTFKTHFEAESCMFTAAFRLALPSESAKGIAHSTSFLANDPPGTVANRSLVKMCSRLMADESNDYRQVLFHVGMMAHGILLGHADEMHVQDCVADLVGVLKDTFIIESLESRYRIAQREQAANSDFPASQALGDR